METRPTQRIITVGDLRASVAGLSDHDLIDVFIYDKEAYGPAKLEGGKPDKDNNFKLEFS